MLYLNRATEIQSSHFLFNGDGSMKPTLLGPPPQIKILKRPQHNGNRGNHGNSNENGQAKPRYQVKTLQQVIAMSDSHNFQKNSLIYQLFGRKRQNMLKPDFAS